MSTTHSGQDKGNNYDFFLIPFGEEKGTTENEMVGWHHQLDGREFG